MGKFKGSKSQFRPPSHLQKSFANPKVLLFLKITFAPQNKKFAPPPKQILICNKFSKKKKCCRIY